MRLIPDAAVLLSTLMLSASAIAGPSHAAGYPYVGLFDQPDADESDDTAAARCALSFFEQKESGDYHFFHLDLGEWRSHRQIAYKEYASGSCSYEPDTKLETCRNQVDLSDRSDQTYDLFTVFTSIAKDQLFYVTFDSLDEAKAAIAAGNLEDSEDVGEYRRCPFDEAVIRSHIKPGLSDQSEDRINEIAAPGQSLLESPEVADIVKLLKEKK